MNDVRVISIFFLTENQYNLNLADFFIRLIGASNKSIKTNVAWQKVKSCYDEVKGSQYFSDLSTYLVKDT